MDIKKLTQEVLLKNMTPEQQLAVLDSVTASVKEAKAVQKQKIAENVDLVLQALKRIEADMLKRVEGSAQVVEDRVKTIKDGKDGKNGLDGKNGKDGLNGKDGKDGRDGRDGLNGKAGERGQDGVGVQNAHIDFDGSLIIALTNGQELNVGEVVPFDVAEKIRVIGNGGGTSQYVLDTLASLQTQINAVSAGLIYKGTWNASTNTPSLASGSGTNGWYYVVSVAGSTNLNGVTDWQVGDWAIFNGTIWQKIDQTNLVTSVAGRTGDVTLTSTDVGLGNVENKSSATIRSEITSSNVTTALGYTPYNSTNPAGYTNNTGTVTSVAVSGGTTGLTTSGGPITGSGTITLAGTLAIANGGTGATSASAALTSLGAYPASNPNGYTSNTGTVTSVTGTSPLVSSGGTTPAISLAASYGDTQNPYASKTANYVLAAPNGSAGVPTFRAIVAADIPTLNQNTTGSAATVTTTINSGVVATTQAAGDNSTKVATTAYVNAITGTNGITGFKNRIINGAMVIDQRNAGASVSASGQYTLDRWVTATTIASKFTVQQNAGSVTPPVGFSSYLGVTSSSAYSIVTGDILAFAQYVEAFNTSDFAWGTANAQTVTLSFWIRSSLTGTFGGALQNSAQNRSYPFSYTISSANTWEQKTITIAGDTSGTWISGTNGVGVRIFFSVGTGATYSGTSGAWAGTQYYSSTGATSVVGTNGATFYITGVQLEKGSTATSFDYRPYGTELALCQRYYYRITAQAAGDYFVPNAYAISTTLAFGYNQFPVPMRTRPTALEQSGTATDYNVVRCGLGTNANCSAVPTFGVADLVSAQTTFTVSGLLINSGAGSVQANNTNAYLGWSAEL